MVLFELRMSDVSSFELTCERHGVVQVVRDDVAADKSTQYHASYARRSVVLGWRCDVQIVHA